jgi:predicted RNA binding protein YcfA (HicA-like mRNA interferase family)
VGLLDPARVRGYDTVTVTMKVREVLRRLKDDGWVLARIAGSHHQFVHPTKPGTVTVAYANGNEGKDLFGKTLDSVFRQAGWK